MRYAVVLILALLTAWLAYENMTLRREAGDWERKATSAMRETQQLRYQMQGMKRSERERPRTPTGAPAGERPQRRFQ